MDKTFGSPERPAGLSAETPADQDGTIQQAGQGSVDTPRPRAASVAVRVTVVSGSAAALAEELPPNHAGIGHPAGVDQGSHASSPLRPHSGRPVSPLGWISAG